MPGTGGAAVWQGVSNIAGAAGALGEVLNKQQAQVEYEAFKFEGNIQALGEKLDKNQDENTYLAETNKVITGANSYMPQNGLAKRFASSLVNQRTPQLRADAGKAIKARIQSKFDAGLITEGEKAAQTGVAVDYLAYVGAGVANGSITPEEAANEISNTRNSMEYQAGLRWARTNPTELLDAIQAAETVDGQVRLGGFETLTEGQVIALRANAEGTENFNKRRGQQATTQYRMEMAEAAQNLSISPGEQFAEIQKLGEPADKENALFKEFMDARNSILRGLGNPYTTTMNHARLKDMRDAARNKTLTEEQIGAAEGKVDGISLSDAEDLRKRLAGTDKANDFRDSSMAKTFINRLEADGTFLDESEFFAKEQGLRWLEAWSKENPNATQREADEQAIRVYERLVREDIEGTLPGTAAELEAERIGPGGVIRKGMEELDKIDLSKIPPTIRTQEEYDALPKGTRYRDKNGDTGIKR
jgi:hypothetical protein